MNYLEERGLPITRAIFTAGQSPYRLIPALNISLYLSADKKAVQAAVKDNYPAGLILPSLAEDDGGEELRIAFDFDGVLADDTAEQIFQDQGIRAFHALSKGCAFAQASSPRSVNLVGSS